MTLLGERDGVGGGALEEGVPGNLLWGIGHVLPLPVPCLLFLGCHSENSSALACSHSRDGATPQNHEPQPLFRRSSCFSWVFCHSNGRS